MLVLVSPEYNATTFVDIADSVDELNITLSSSAEVPFTIFDWMIAPNDAVTNTRSYTFITRRRTEASKDIIFNSASFTTTGTIEFNTASGVGAQVQFTNAGTIVEAQRILFRNVSRVRFENGNLTLRATGGSLRDLPDFNDAHQLTLEGGSISFLSSVDNVIATGGLTITGSLSHGGALELNAGTNTLALNGNVATTSGELTLVAGAITAGGTGARVISSAGSLSIFSSLSYGGGALTLMADSTSGTLTLTGDVTTSAGALTLTANGISIADGVAALELESSGNLTLSGSWQRGNMATDLTFTAGGELSLTGDIGMSGAAFGGVIFSVGVSSLPGANSIAAAGANVIAATFRIAYPNLADTDENVFAADDAIGNLELTSDGTNEILPRYQLGNAIHFFLPVPLDAHTAVDCSHGAQAADCAITRDAGDPADNVIAGDDFAATNSITISIGDRDLDFRTGSGSGEIVIEAERISITARAILIGSRPLTIRATGASGSGLTLSADITGTAADVSTTIALSSTRDFLIRGGPDFNIGGAKLTLTVSGFVRGLTVDGGLVRVIAGELEITQNSILGSAIFTGSSGDRASSFDRLTILAMTGGGTQATHDWMFAAGRTVSIESKGDGTTGSIRIDGIAAAAAVTIKAENFIRVDGNIGTSGSPLTGLLTLDGEVFFSGSSSNIEIYATGITFQNGTNAISASRSLTLNAGTGTLTLDRGIATQGNPLTLTAGTITLTGTGARTFRGDRGLTITGAITYSGGSLTLRAGPADLAAATTQTLTLNSDATVSGAGNGLTLSAGTIALGGSASATRTFQAAGDLIAVGALTRLTAAVDLTLTSDGDVTFSGDIGTSSAPFGDVVISVGRDDLPLTRIAAAEEANLFAASFSIRYPNLPNNAGNVASAANSVRRNINFTLAGAAVPLYFLSGTAVTPVPPLDTNTATDCSNEEQDAECLITRAEDDPATSITAGTDFSATTSVTITIGDRNLDFSGGNGAITISAKTVSITAGNIILGMRSLTITASAGSLTLNAGITGSGNVALTASGSGKSVAIGRDLGASLELLAGTLTVTAPSVTFGTGARTINFNGNIQFNGSIGHTGNLFISGDAVTTDAITTSGGLLDLNGSSSLTLRGNIMATGSDITLSSNTISLGAGAREITNAGGDIFIFGPITHTAALTVNASGGLFLDGDITLTGSNKLTLTGGTGINLDASLTLMTGGALELTGEIDDSDDSTDSRTLTLDAAGGDVTLNDNVRLTGAGSALTINSGGTITRGGTDRLILDADSLTLQQDSAFAEAFAADAASSPPFQLLVGSGQTLALTTAAAQNTYSWMFATGRITSLESTGGAITIGAALTAAAAAVTFKASGGINVNFDIGTSGSPLTGLLTLDGNVVFGGTGGRAIYATGITFTGTITGTAANRALTLNAGSAALTLVGGTIDTGTAALSLAGSTIRRSGNTTFEGGAITITGEVQDNRALTVTASNVLTLNGNINIGSSTLILEGSTISLGGNTTIRGGTITITGEIDESANNRALTVIAANNLMLNSNINTGTANLQLTTTSGATSIIASESITLAGSTITFNSDIEVSASKAIELTVTALRNIVLGGDLRLGFTSRAHVITLTAGTGADVNDGAIQNNGESRNVLASSTFGRLVFTQDVPFASGLFSSPANFVDRASLTITGSAQQELHQWMNDLAQNHLTIISGGELRIGRNIGGDLSDITFDASVIRFTGSPARSLVATANLSLSGNIIAENGLTLNSPVLNLDEDVTSISSTAGDISFASGSVVTFRASSLEINAAGNMILSATSISDEPAANNAALTLRAGRNITINNPLEIGGALDIVAGSVEGFDPDQDQTGAITFSSTSLSINAASISLTQDDPALLNTANAPADFSATPSVSYSGNPALIPEPPLPTWFTVTSLGPEIGDGTANVVLTAANITMISDSVFITVDAGTNAITLGADVPSGTITLVSTTTLVIRAASLDLGDRALVFMADGAILRIGGNILNAGGIDLGAGGMILFTQSAASEIRASNPAGGVLTITASEITTEGDNDLLIRSDSGLALNANVNVGAGRLTLRADVDAITSTISTGTGTLTAGVVELNQASTTSFGGTAPFTFAGSVGHLILRSNTADQRSEAWMFVDGRDFEYRGAHFRFRGTLATLNLPASDFTITVDSIDIRVALNITANNINITSTDSATESASSITLSAAENLTFSVPTNITGTVSLTAGTSGTGEISGTAAINAGVVSLTQPAFTATAPLPVTTGELRLTATAAGDHVLHPWMAVSGRDLSFTANPGAVVLNGDFEIDLAALTLTGSSGISLGSDAGLFADAITLSGAITSAGNHALVVRARNGAITLNNNINIGTGALTLRGTAPLSLGGDITLTGGAVRFRSVIDTSADNRALTVVASGVLTLENNINTGTAALSLMGASLALSGDITLTGGAITLAAAFDGSGNTSALTINAGGILTLNADINTGTADLALSAATSILFSADRMISGGTVSLITPNIMGAGQTLTISADTEITTQDSTAGTSVPMLNVGTLSLVQGNEFTLTAPFTLDALVSSLVIERIGVNVGQMVQGWMVSTGRALTVTATGRIRVGQDIDIGVAEAGDVLTLRGASIRVFGGGTLNARRVVLNGVIASRNVALTISAGDGGIVLEAGVTSITAGRDSEFDLTLGANDVIGVFEAASLTLAGDNITFNFADLTTAPTDLTIIAQRNVTITNNINLTAALLSDTAQTEGGRLDIRAGRAADQTGTITFTAGASARIRAASVTLLQDGDIFPTTVPADFETPDGTDIADTGNPEEVRINYDGAAAPDPIVWAQFVVFSTDPISLGSGTDFEITFADLARFGDVALNSRVSITLDAGGGMISFAADVTETDIRFEAPLITITAAGGFDLGEKSLTIIAAGGTLTLGATLTSSGDITLDAENIAFAGGQNRRVSGSLISITSANAITHTHNIIVRAAGNLTIEADITLPSTARLILEAGDDRDVNGAPVDNKGQVIFVGARSFTAGRIVLIADPADSATLDPSNGVLSFTATGAASATTMGILLGANLDAGSAAILINGGSGVITFNAVTLTGSPVTIQSNSAEDDRFASVPDGFDIVASGLVIELGSAVSRQDLQSWMVAGSRDLTIRMAHSAPILRIANNLSLDFGVRAVNLLPGGGRVLFVRAIDNDGNRIEDNIDLRAGTITLGGTLGGNGDFRSSTSSVMLTAGAGGVALMGDVSLTNDLTITTTGGGAVDLQGDNVSVGTNALAITGGTGVIGGRADGTTVLTAGTITLMQSAALTNAFQLADAVTSLTITVASSTAQPVMSWMASTDGNWDLALTNTGGDIAISSSVNVGAGDLTLTAASGGQIAVSGTGEIQLRGENITLGSAVTGASFTDRRLLVRAASALTVNGAITLTGANANLTLRAATFAPGTPMLDAAMVSLVSNGVFGGTAPFSFAAGVASLTFDARSTTNPQTVEGWMVPSSGSRTVTINANGISIVADVGGAANLVLDPRAGALSGPADGTTAVLTMARSVTIRANVALGEMDLVIGRAASDN